MSYAAERWDCPDPRPARASVYARTLHRACQVLGGVAPLAAHLKVHEAELERWIEDAARPPMEVFLAAVEVVLLHSERAGGSVS